jgi:hypothetical protein
MERGKYFASIFSIKYEYAMVFFKKKGGRIAGSASSDAHKNMLLI